MTERDAVLEEFAHDAGVHRLCRVSDMADEIVRLRDENAALRERLATAELKLDFTTAVSQPQWVPPPQTGWVCPVCGKGNAPWNLSCSCKQTIVKQEVGVSEFDKWKKAAHMFGESLAPVGPDGYYSFSPDQWLKWAKDQICASEILRLRTENAALTAAVERVRAACENELRWIDAQPILRALEETP